VASQSIPGDAARERTERGVADRIRGDGVQTEIGAPLKDRDFALVFEPGSVVWDERAKQEYLVRKDGSKQALQRPRWKNPLPEN
jgi:hypothetical protein